MSHFLWCTAAFPNSFQPHLHLERFSPVLVISRLKTDTEGFIIDLLKQAWLIPQLHYMSPVMSCVINFTLSHDERPTDATL